jgi:hypothetical protein
MATTTTTATVGGGTTVDNLNVLDTSKTNDLSGTEYITLQEVANALFPTANATQTLTIDSSFWSGGLGLTFSVGSQYYTISGATSLTGTHSIQLALTDAFGSYSTSLNVFSTLLISSTDSAATDVNNLLAWMAQQTLATSSSLLVSADIEGSIGKDNIQGISSNSNIHNIIQGGTGADVMSGGTGSDYFVYQSGLLVRRPTEQRRDLRPDLGSNYQFRTKRGGSGRGQARLYCAP